MIFNIISGVAKAYNTSKTGSEHIAAFLYPEDMLGLSEGGKYTNSAKGLTSVTAYALPAQAFQRRLSKGADLDIQVITKLARRLRQAQRHALLLAQRHSLSRLATFSSTHSVTSRPCDGNISSDGSVRYSKLCRHVPVRGKQGLSCLGGGRCHHVPRSSAHENHRPQDV